MLWGIEGGKGLTLTYEAYTTAVVGIDIIKDHHVAQVTDYHNRVLTPRALTFSNSEEVFLKFQHRMYWPGINCPLYYRPLLV